jgi:hypothetical protein
MGAVEAVLAPVRTANYGSSSPRAVGPCRGVYGFRVYCKYTTRRRRGQAGARCGSLSTSVESVAPHERACCPVRSPAAEAISLGCRTSHGPRQHTSPPWPALDPRRRAVANASAGGAAAGHWHTGTVDRSPAYTSPRAGLQEGLATAATRCRSGSTSKCICIPIPGS